MKQNLPNIGNRFYFMHREVIVLSVYEEVQLIRIYDISASSDYFVDIHAVTDVPDQTSSISLNLLRGMPI